MFLRFLFFIRTFLKHCKALSTEKYRRYINVVVIIIKLRRARSHIPATNQDMDFSRGEGRDP